MISALGYVYAPKNHVATNQLLEKAPGEGKLFVQIFGKEPELMAQAAARLSQTGRFDGVDINMGCPAHKVACSGEGSGLMRDPKKAEAIIRAVVAATSLPVSVKFRLGWDAATINVEELAEMAQELGAHEVAVHGPRPPAAVQRQGRLGSHRPGKGAATYSCARATAIFLPAGCRCAHDPGNRVRRCAHWPGRQWEIHGCFGQIKQALRGGPPGRNPR